MAKTTLVSEIEVKMPGSRSFAKGSFSLDWEGRYLELSRRKRTSVDLTTILQWVIVKKQVRTVRGIIEQQQICLSLPHRKKSRDLLLRPSPAEFNTLLYWLLISIQKHAKVNLSDGILKKLPLKASRRGKLLARGNMASFDTLYRHFSKSIQLYKQGADLGIGRSGPAMHGASGRQYRGFKGVGKMGGSGTRLFITNKRAIDIVVGTERDMIFHPPPEPVVVKVATMASFIDGFVPDVGEALVREARILAAIGEHENIIRIIDALAARDGIYMFLEKGDGDLEDRAQGVKLTVQQFLLVALGTLKGLAHMHNRRIYHLDMKPANVLLFSGNIPKIIDFGLTISRGFDSREDALGNWVGFIGTPGYVAKECWGKKPTGKGQLSDYLAKRDSYATGMTFLDAFIGPHFSLKYSGGNMMNPQDAARKQKWWQDQMTRVLPRIKDPSLMAFISLTLSMIDGDISRRTTITQALDLLSAANPDLLKLRRAEKIRQSRKALQVFRHIHETVGDDIPIMEALVKYN